MPLYSSYLLQPLDIGCFATLKRLYSRLIEDYIRLGIHYVNKLDFITVYLTACAEALTASNIYSGFAAIGLVLFDPSQVLLKLQIYITPPGSPYGSTSSI